MTTITIYGCAHAILIDDDGGALNSIPCTHANIFIRHADETLMVVAHYSPVTPKLSNNGCWMIGIQPENEASPVPEWPVRFRTSEDYHYSPELIIEAPDGYKITLIDSNNSFTELV